MADIEYSDHYAIFVTEGGVRYLTNPVSIKIMDMLQHSLMTSSDIALELDLSKSSIQSNMMKLSRMQLVDSYQDNDDKRRVIYYPSSFKCIESVDVKPEVLRMEKDILDRIVTNREGHDSALLMLTSIMPLSVGISVDPLLERCGRLSAHYILKVMGKMDDDAFIENMKNIYKGASFPPVEMELQNGILVAKLHHNDDMLVESLISTRLIIGSLCQSMMERTGDLYRLDSMLEDDGTTVMIFKPYENCFKKRRYDIASEDTREDNPYAIYFLGDRSILFGNITQMRILDALMSDKRSLKQLSEDLEIPPVTVHMNIAKLMEIGAICSDSDTRSKYVYYYINALPMLVPIRSEKGCVRLIEEMFSSLAEDPSNYYRCAFRYVTCALRMTGIDGTGLMYRTGSNFAKALIAHEPNIEPENFISKICGIDISYGIDAKVISHIPLKISVDRRDLGNTEYRHVLSFYEGMIRSGLKELTGTDYKVCFENR